MNELRLSYRISSRNSDLTSLRLAIGEAWKKDKLDNWYPPNAYHTYWTLHILEAVKSRFPEEYGAMVSKIEYRFTKIERLRSQLKSWAREEAGYQIALHSTDSSALDSDQLVWSLATILEFDSDFQANLSKQDFIRYGLECLFTRQTAAGHWRTGAPLFHYKRSGNAYCYVFESFTVLLKSALNNRSEGIFVRQLLWPFADNLHRLWKYARSTEIPLSEEAQAFGWSSGHRPDRKTPESWATASVYSFSQCLRRLVGIWTREMAASDLKVEKPRQSYEKSMRTLDERGDTWTRKGSNVAIQLTTFFVNPARYYGSEGDLEPDRRTVEADQACAAILFGPPGTSKTTLSQSIAGAIGWDYVELHASHFVADGLPNVQRTADTIFGKLMQLDRTVILFDEIDELVRSRGMEPDAFGRFLTTSMLPKLAELWKARKVIYFVATNHIRFFDPAITRAQRFDALVDVSPPSFNKKVAKLKDLLNQVGVQVDEGGLTRESIEEGLNKACQAGEAAEKNKIGSSNDTLLPVDATLAKFLLMRWDQLAELASLLKVGNGTCTRVTLTPEALAEGLKKLSDPSLKKCDAYRNYSASSEYQQHDYSKSIIWEIEGDISDRFKSIVKKAKKRNWYICRDFEDFGDLSGILNVIKPGILKIKSD